MIDALTVDLNGTFRYLAAVCAGKIWREVARGLIPAAEHQSNTGYLMRIVYEKHLLAFEEHLTRSGHPMGVAAGGAKGVKAEPGGMRAGGQVSGRGGGGRGRGGRERKRLGTGIVMLQEEIAGKWTVWPNPLVLYLLMGFYPVSPRVGSMER